MRQLFPTKRWKKCTTNGGIQLLAIRHSDRVPIDRAVPRDRHVCMYSAFNENVNVISARGKILFCQKFTEIINIQCVQSPLLAIIAFMRRNVLSTVSNFPACEITIDQILSNEFLSKELSNSQWECTLGTLRVFTNNLDDQIARKRIFKDWFNEGDQSWMLEDNGHLWEIVEFREIWRSLPVSYFEKLVNTSNNCQRWRLNRQLIDNC